MAVSKRIIPHMLTALASHFLEILPLVDITQNSEDTISSHADEKIILGCSPELPPETQEVYMGTTVSTKEH